MLYRLALSRRIRVVHPMNELGRSTKQCRSTIQGRARGRVPGLPLHFCGMMWCDAKDIIVRRVDYYIILEPTTVDTMLFLNVQGAQSPTNRTPARPRPLPCSRPDCRMPHALVQGINSRDIFFSGLIGAIGGGAIDGSATGGSAAGGDETGGVVSGSAMAAV